LKRVKKRAKKKTRIEIGLDLINVDLIVFKSKETCIYIHIVKMQKNMYIRVLYRRGYGVVKI
jgi:hypothetical protein